MDGGEDYVVEDDDGDSVPAGGRFWTSMNSHRRTGQGSAKFNNIRFREGINKLF